MQDKPTLGLPPVSTATSAGEAHCAHEEGSRVVAPTLDQISNGATYVENRGVIAITWMNTDTSR